ncbi:hypothetical protein DACRYDRAFT_118460 [Dacryopinax primogenitus]|uniref:histone acetyltransferase n=1 Tax=Dacryopinax primogenitus (strain DJM 731) TaxID=1858805 RepID=M5FTD9_DACPD|nr:uncharacterized protein DACRYDRAFT_118460 [Dacryopinax primogenitus]EJT98644.1 hypothetical protein DACRYDRAFT_118460 [Dacryopinax primogenitus]
MLQPLTPLPLRDHVLASLSPLPGKRQLQLDVLVTPVRKHSGLFPYSRPRVRTWVQEVLLLLFESPGQPLDPNTQESTTAVAGASRVCTAALEAYIYYLPSTGASILYVSKVDSSGLSLPPSPVSTLTRAFLSHICAPAYRPAPSLWVHVFARAQGQYMFPNSSENGRKKVLGDARLCSWWKALLDDVIRDIVTPEQEPSVPPAELVSSGEGNDVTKNEVITTAHTSAASDPPKYSAFYLLPGYPAIEASRLLSFTTPSDQPTPISWTYSHPYLHPVFPLPTGVSPTKRGLADCIPYFEDDPKARFILELASDVEPSLPRKRQKTAPAPCSPTKQRKESDADTLNLSKKVHKEESKEKDEGPTPEERALARTGVDDFWELMPHRQECSSGAVTGFFVLVFPSSAFSSKSSASAGKHDALPPSAPGQVSQGVLSRVTSALLDLDFGTVERGYRASGVLQELVRVCCVPAVAPTGDAAQSKAAVTDQEGKDIYTAYVSASVSVDNPLPVRAKEKVEEKPQVVNVLQVRKKRRAA